MSETTTNNDVPDATAPAPLTGAEQAAAGQTAPETSAIETVFNVADGVVNGAALVIDIVSIFD